jgi:hypothetical protein
MNTDIRRNAGNPNQPVSGDNPAAHNVGFGGTARETRLQFSGCDKTMGIIHLSNNIAILSKEIFLF